MVVDVTDCRVEKLHDYATQKVLYSGRSKLHCLIAVKISTGLFVWFSGGWPGSYNDLLIIRQSGLLDKLSRSEMLMADKIYIGEGKILTAFKGAKGAINLGSTQKFIADASSLKIVFLGSNTSILPSMNGDMNLSFIHKHLAH